MPKVDLEPLSGGGEFGSFLQEGGFWQRVRDVDVNKMYPGAYAYHLGQLDSTPVWWDIYPPREIFERTVGETSYAVESTWSNGFHIHPVGSSTPMISSQGLPLSGFAGSAAVTGDRMLVNIKYDTYSVLGGYANSIPWTSREERWMQTRLLPAKPSGISLSYLPVDGSGLFGPEAMPAGFYRYSMSWDVDRFQETARTRLGGVTLNGGDDVAEVTLTFPTTGEWPFSDMQGNDWKRISGFHLYREYSADGVRFSAPYRISTVDFTRSFDEINYDLADQEVLASFSFEAVDQGTIIYRPHNVLMARLQESIVTINDGKTASVVLSDPIPEKIGPWHEPIDTLTDGFVYPTNASTTGAIHPLCDYCVPLGNGTLEGFDGHPSGFRTLYVVQKYDSITEKYIHAGHYIGPSNNGELQSQSMNEWHYAPATEGTVDDARIFIGYRYTFPTITFRSETQPAVSSTFQQAILGPLGLPAVNDLPDLFTNIPESDDLSFDGFSGLFEAGHDVETIRVYRIEIDEVSYKRLSDGRNLSCLTEDGVLFALDGGYQTADYEFQFGAILMHQGNNQYYRLFSRLKRISDVTSGPLSNLVPSGFDHVAERKSLINVAITDDSDSPDAVTHTFTGFSGLEDVADMQTLKQSTLCRLLNGQDTVRKGESGFLVTNGSIADVDVEDNFSIWSHMSGETGGMADLDGDNVQQTVKSAEGLFKWRLQFPNYDGIKYFTLPCSFVQRYADSAWALHSSSSCLPRITTSKTDHNDVEPFAIVGPNFYHNFGSGARKAFLENDALLEFVDATDVEDVAAYTVEHADDYGDMVWVKKAEETGPSLYDRLTPSGTQMLRYGLNDASNGGGKFDTNDNNEITFTFKDGVFNQYAMAPIDPIDISFDTSIVASSRLLAFNALVDNQRHPDRVYYSQIDANGVPLYGHFISTGYISIPGANGSMFHPYLLGSGVLLFASDGIYFVDIASQNEGMWRATLIASNLRLLSKNKICKVGPGYVFATRDGLFSITPDLEINQIMKTTGEIKSILAASGGDLSVDDQGLFYLRTSDGTWVLDTSTGKATQLSQRMYHVNDPVSGETKRVVSHAQGVTVFQMPDIASVTSEMNAVSGIPKGSPMIESRDEDFDEINKKVFKSLEFEYFSNIGLQLIVSFRDVGRSVVYLSPTSDGSTVRFRRIMTELRAVSRWFKIRIEPFDNQPDNAQFGIRGMVVDFDITDAVDAEGVQTISRGILREIGLNSSSVGEEVGDGL